MEAHLDIAVLDTPACPDVGEGVGTHLQLECIDYHDGLLLLHGQEWDEVI